MDKIVEKLNRLENGQSQIIRQIESLLHKDENFNLLHCDQILDIHKNKITFLMHKVKELEDEILKLKNS